MNKPIPYSVCSNSKFPTISTILRRELLVSWYLKAKMKPRSVFTS